MVKIRKATNKDCEKMANIYNQYLGKATMDLFPKTENDYIEFLKNLDEREAYYVIQLAEKIIGWGCIKKYSPKAGYKFTAETSCFLDRNWLRKGYGTKLKTFLMQKAKALDYRHLTAKIFANNKASIQYNLKLGYRIVGIQHKVGFVNGLWKDVTIMEYFFEET